MTVSVPPTGSYRLDPAHSRIAFTGKHMFGMGSVRGSFAVTGGELTVAEPASASSLTATASARSIDTENTKRDDKVRSKQFLDTDAYPDITFRADRLVQDGDTWTAPGQLTAHGTAAPFTLTVTSVTDAGGSLTLEGSGTVDRYAHGISAMKGMAGRHLELEITAKASRI